MSQSKVVQLPTPTKQEASPPEVKLNSMSAKSLAEIDVESLDNDALKRALLSVQRGVVLHQLHKDHRSHSNGGA